MKQLFTLLIAAVLVLPACKKSKPGIAYMGTGTIMGRSPAMNICAGKYWIKIDDSAIIKTFDSLPSGCTINPDFVAERGDSVRVKLNWHTDNVCGIITIDAIEKIN